MTRERTREGGGPEPGSQAKHEKEKGEVTKASATASSSEASSRDAAESSLPGKRRLQKVAGSTRSVEGSAYQGAMEASFAIVIAALLGYWADEHFGTTPRWLIVGVVIGFATFVLRLMRMAKLVQAPHPDSESGEEPGQRDSD